MIHDYYLSKAKLLDFERWKQNKKESLDKSHDKKKLKKWQRKPEDEKYKEWLDEIFQIPLGKNKKQILEKSKENDFTKFYPNFNEFKTLPKDSVLIKISFTLKKPYTSKDEGEFHIINNRIFENPIVRDKFTGLPIVRPSSWKGHLRFAARKVKWNEEEKEKKEKEKIIKRLFGSKADDENALKGRLYFFPTFFEDEVGKDVITPLKRDTRTPRRGPIYLEVMKPNTKGEFYLLYFPYPRDENFKEDEVKEDIEFLAEALKLMFYTYGFSAKKTSGFGVIERLEEGDVKVYPKDKKECFSILYTKVNKNVNYGA